MKAFIKDIYAGMPDAKDEVFSDNSEKFFESFIVPPELPVNKLMTGEKFLVSGYKGVGKTSVLYYLQDRAQAENSNTCCSFIYFKSDYEELRKSQMDMIAKKLTSLVDISGEIQPNKVEYLHIWRWVFFKQIVDDSTHNINNLFEEDDNWNLFVKKVNSICFNSKDKHVISLSSLAISTSLSTKEGAKVSANADFEIKKSIANFQRFTNTVDECEALFGLLRRTNIPYYIFVDEIEAFYGDKDLFTRDLTLIRDLLFTIHRLNMTKQVRIIAAIRSEIINAMDRFITTREINKIVDGYTVPIKWSYSNTNSLNHPIIQVLMKRIAMACPGQMCEFKDWFPDEIYGKDTVSYILDNGWNKPRDIVRFITAAQNDSLHCNDVFFSKAAIETLMKEYSRNSLAEIRQELQSLYSSTEIELALRLLRGGPRIVDKESIRKRAAKGSPARQFWDERGDDVVEDFYRVGIFGNINRYSYAPEWKWRWNHKDDTGVLTDNHWELVVHHAICKELSIPYNID
ncbi:MAG: hypothetical protein K6F68_08895 [Clostridiales bacterium]|nr:hypothetical protein [Clostridiales bacterium]